MPDKRGVIRPLSISKLRAEDGLSSEERECTTHKIQCLGRRRSFHAFIKGQCCTFLPHDANTTTLSRRGLQWRISLMVAHQDISGASYL